MRRSARPTGQALCRVQKGPPTGDLAEAVEAKVRLLQLTDFGALMINTLQGRFFPAGMMTADTRKRPVNCRSKARVRASGQGHRGGSRQSAREAGFSGCVLLRGAIMADIAKKTGKCIAFLDVG